MIFFKNRIKNKTNINIFIRLKIIKLINMHLKLSYIITIISFRTLQCSIYYLWLNNRQSIIQIYVTIVKY